MTDIEDLWKYACSGDIEALRKYYDDGGSINNRYFKAGTSHSLIMGAFRNNQFETVEYLLSVGEDISKEERSKLRMELKKFNIFKELAEMDENTIGLNQSQTM